MAARTPDVALPSLLASYLLVSVQTPPPGRRPPSFAPMSLEVAVVLSLNTDGSWFLCAVQGSLMRLPLPGTPACCIEHLGRVPSGCVSVRECPWEEKCGQQWDLLSSGSFICKGQKLVTWERDVALRADGASAGGQTAPRTSGGWPRTAAPDPSRPLAHLCRASVRSWVSALVACSPSPQSPCPRS